MICNATTAAHIISNLSIALGGAPPDHVVGAAIFGRANNAPYPWEAEQVRDLISAAAALIADYWNEEVTIVSAKISLGFRGAREKVQGTHAPEI